MEKTVELMKKGLFLLALALIAAGGVFAQEYNAGEKYKYYTGGLDEGYRTLRVATKSSGAIDTGGFIQLVRARCAGDPNIVEILSVADSPNRRAKIWNVGQKTTVEELLKDEQNVRGYRIRTPNSGYFVEFATYDFDNYQRNRKFGVVLPGSDMEFYSSTSIQIQSGAVGWDDAFLAANNLEDFMTYLAESVDYNWVVRMVADTKKAFDNAKTKVCPIDGPLCDCKGDINEHIIINATIGAGLWGALWGLAPPWLLPVEFYKVRAQFTAQAYLAASIGYLNGRFPNGGAAFQQQLKRDNYVLFAGSGPDNISLDGILSGPGMETVGQETLQFAATEIMKRIAPRGLSAVPIAGTVWSVSKGAYDGMKDAQAMGRRAAKYYSAKGGATDLPTNVNVVFQTARASATSKDGFLAPNGTDPKNNTAIHLWDMNGNEPAMPHRLFKLVHLGDGWYQVKNNKYGALDVPNAKNQNNLQMQLFEQGNEKQNQRFRFVSVGNGLYQIWTSYGRNLHAQNGGTKNGTRVVTWEGSLTDNNQNQNWRIYTVDNQGKLTQWPSGGSTPTPSGGILGGITRTIQGIFGGTPASSAPSINTLTWSSANSPFGTTGINAVAFGNNTWVAVGQRGQIAYSSDGRSWTAPQQLAVDSVGRTITTHLTSVAFGNSRWIAVGNGRDVTSTDNGRTWTEIRGIPTNPDYTIAFAGGRFVSTTYKGRIGYSTDGTTWTAVTAPEIFGNTAQAPIIGLAYGNNRWVAGGRGPIAYSTNNGAAWTAAGDSTFGVGDRAQIYGIAYGNNRFVAVGAAGKIAYSADGVRWTAVPPGTARDPGQTTFYNRGIYGIAFGNNRFVAVGGDGRIAYSADGATWTAVENSPFGTTHISAVAYANGRFVAVGREGKIAYSE